MPGPAPPRGSRPRNRRALIRAIAAELFAERGYDQVGMSDIAEAVAIGPSALYRHYAGKQDLLRDVVIDNLAPLGNLLEELDLAAGGAARMAGVSLDHARSGVLWQREARHLPPEDLTELRAGVRRTAHLLASLLRQRRGDLDPRHADLLSWAALSVLSSPSFHTADLPRPGYDHVLAELVDRVLELSLPHPIAAPVVVPAPVLRPASRREALLSKAVPMFAAHGYANVGIDDIGNAVGIAGPSVYNHFPTKLDMLDTAFQRGNATLMTELESVYRSAGSAEEALLRLIASYQRFAFDHHDLIGILIMEIGHLSEEVRHATRRAQRDYLSEWIHLHHQANPGLSPAVAQVEVHAAVSVINDAARTGHLRRSPGVPDCVRVVAARLLRLNPGSLR
ncbi:TetR/AcrR family transcriptional regulator [Amycolatopsis sp. GM8]|uniref:TetR/AcrR family transcriptional regulator n=1 Tax=Amycolatopsis sp. GM8 TaxID=2896530 RepID=UPI001F3C87FA|nr:TetR/AcrR family transcriptional regulator [Amycolatopsis sp. GM8]